MADSDLKDEDSLELLMKATEAPPIPTKKVELDLDDAPFLQTEKETLPAPSHSDVVPDAPDDEAERKRRRKKRLIIIGASAAVILLAAGFGAWRFFLAGEPEEEAGLEPEIIVVPKVAGDAAPNELVRPFEPFIVPVKGPDGKTSFLVCKFSAIAKDAKINQEMDSQRVALRDAIYFYLRGKDSDYLQDARNAPAIKSDIVSIFNDYLTQGQLEDILFESYLSH